MTGLGFVGNVIEHKITSLLIISSSHLTAYSIHKCSVYRGLVFLRDMHSCYRFDHGCRVISYYTIVQSLWLSGTISRWHFCDHYKCWDLISLIIFQMLHLTFLLLNYGRTYIFRIEISIMPFKFKIIMSIHDFFDILRTIWAIKQESRICVR